MNKVFIKLKNVNNYKVLIFLSSLNVNVYSVSFDNDLILEVMASDLDIISKYYKYMIVKDTLFRRFLSFIRSNFFNLLLVLLFFVLSYFYSFIVIGIDVISSNSSLNDFILNELDRNNIKKFTFFKSEEYLSKVKDKIVSDNSEQLEWLNIYRKGMKYIVNVSPKVKPLQIDNYSYCNIVSGKDAIISKVVVDSGEVLVDINDYVSKGDLLVSGDVKYNEEIKKQVCASGKIYGHTWYTIDISVPKYSYDLGKTGKCQKNIKFRYDNKYNYLMKDRYNDGVEDEYPLFNLFKYKVIFSKKCETVIRYSDLSSEDIDIKIRNLVNEKVSLMTDNEGIIISQKTLKKSENDSKIELELFIVVEEPISVLSYS